MSVPGDQVKIHTPAPTNYTPATNKVDGHLSGLDSALTLGGDLSGSPSSATVIGLRGVSVPATSPSTGYGLVGSGGTWTVTKLPGHGSLVDYNNVGSPASAVSLNGQNLVPGQRIIIEADFTSAGLASTFNIFLNGNMTTTNYQIERSEQVAGGETYYNGVGGIEVGKINSPANGSCRSVIDIGVVNDPVSGLRGYVTCAYNNWSNRQGRCTGRTLFDVSPYIQSIIIQGSGLTIGPGSEFSVWKFVR